MARVWLVAAALMGCTAPGTGTGTGTSTGTEPTVPQATTDGIQIGEGGDTVPCDWVDVADEGDVSAAEAEAEALAGRHEGVLSLWSGVDEGLAVEVTLGQAQVQQLTPLYTGGMACGERRVVWPAAVVLDGESVQEAGPGEVWVLQGGAGLWLEVPLAEASSEPRLLTVDDYPPISLVFELSADLQGTLGWAASEGDGSLSYYEVTGSWVGE